jgi:hypothetical protein
MLKLKEIIGLLAAIQRVITSASNPDPNKISLREPVTLPISFVAQASVYYGQITLVVGAYSSSTSEGVSVNMIPDLTSNRIIVGSVPKLSWGIDCSPLTSCTPIPNTTHVCSRLGSTAECQSISTFIRFRNQTLPATSNPLTIDMMLTSDTWVPKNIGVFGIGPNSPIWSYLKNEYDTNKDYIDFSLFYRATELKSLISLANDNFKNSIMVVNGKGIAIDPFFVTVNKTGSDYWKITSVNFTKTIDGKVTESVEQVCLANSLNYTLATNIFPQMKAQILQEICGGSATCTKENSNIYNMSRIQVTLYNETDMDSRFNIDLKPEELVNFDESGNLVLLFQDIAELAKTPQPICAGATLAFGKYFLSARESVLRYNKKTELYMIGFHSFEPSLLFLFILLTLAIIIFNIFVIICICSIVKKVRAQKEIVEKKSLMDKETDPDLNPK